MTVAVVKFRSVHRPFPVRTLSGPEWKLERWGTLEPVIWERYQSPGRWGRSRLGARLRRLFDPGPLRRMWPR